MGREWFQAHMKLKNFMMEHPEIQITHRVIAIPENVRPEFYRQFNQVRTAFLKEQLPNFPRETKRLKENYVKAEEDVKGLLELEEIFIARDLYHFLNDANGRLAQELFDLLFNLLKGQIDDETFEKEAARYLKRSYGELFQWAYQKWIVLSLVILLKANKIFSVTVPPVEMTPRGPKIVVEPQSVPKPQESRQLSLLRDTTPVFIAPDFIIYSPMINRFVSFGAEIGNLDIRSGVMWKAAEASPGREWYNLEALEPLWRRYNTLNLRFDLIIYTHDKIEDIALIADSERICRPDLILVCMERVDPLEKALEKASLYKTFLNPKYGTFIFSISPSKKLVQDKAEEGTFLLPIGFNQAKMNSIVNALSLGNIR
ncbi:MAG: hypothetical protein QME90_09890 [Thermodesulfobacteriota bacterium]|nr:hypothetical protein [Thermodesulfobacteriota bacterium]